MTAWLSGWIRTRMLYTNGSSYFMNVWNWYKPDNDPESDVMAIAGLMYTFWTDQLKAVMPASISFVECVATDMTGPGGWEARTQLGAPEAGLVQGNVLPGNVTVAIKLHTGHAGRSYNGRIYHIGLMESQVTGDTINANDINTLSGVYTDLPDWCFSSNGYRMVVLSRYLNGVERVTASAHTVTGISIDGTVDSQRRRLTGRGR